jgi:hypothetical protein
MIIERYKIRERKAVSRRKHELVMASKKNWRLVLAAGLGLWCGGCATNWQTAALVAGGATVTGAHSPDREIEQVYYLGVFDPRDQIPSSIYRVAVHGQASFISGVKFASGWVPAHFVDSLSSRIRFQAGDESGALTLTPAGTNEFGGLKQGRKLVLFGPEGFREAPKDHRLVLVMGASPKDYFEALDRAMGAAGRAMHGQFDEKTRANLQEQMRNAVAELARTEQFREDLKAEFPLK